MSESLDHIAPAGHGMDSCAVSASFRERTPLPTKRESAGSRLRPTPVAGSTPGQRRGGFATLTEGLDYAARSVAGFNFYAPRGNLETVLPFATLRRQAMETARKLIHIGLRRGDRVAVVARTGPDFIAAFFGCQYAGLIPCPLPCSIAIGGGEAYVGRIAGMLKSAEATCVLGPPELTKHLFAAAGLAATKLIMTHDDLAAVSPSDHCLDPFGPDDAAYIQYSSGSTSDPKGVLITQSAICANATGILRYGLNVTPEDRAFSWLPLYHDMGLVGFCLAAMMGQVSVDYLDTAAFARRPALWLKLMSENRSTIAYSPSFGYDLAARRVNGHAAALDLSAWRIAGIGGDMVRPDSLDGFARKMAAAGFDATAFMPSYGMAEATLAVTFADSRRPVRVDRVAGADCKSSGRADPAVMAQGRERIFVSCGRPLPGHEIAVRDENRKPLGDRRIGHIWIRGPSLMAGYFGNEQATRAVFDQEGWMNTGDMGYRLDGEIIVTGRSKDLILYNGRNIWPQDIEWAIEREASLRNGDVAAFAVATDAGEDKVVILVQCRPSDRDQRNALLRRAFAAVSRHVGIECEIILVAPRSLPVTSSGKLSRAGARKRFLARELATLSQQSA